MGQTHPRLFRGGTWPSWSFFFSPLERFFDFFFFGKEDANWLDWRFFLEVEIMETSRARLLPGRETTPATLLLRSALINNQIAQAIENGKIMKRHRCGALRHFLPPCHLRSTTVRTVVNWRQVNFYWFISQFYTRNNSIDWSLDIRMQIPKQIADHLFFVYSIIKVIQINFHIKSHSKILEFYKTYIAK